MISTDISLRQRIEEWTREKTPESIKQLILLLMEDRDAAVTGEVLNALKTFTIEDVLAPLVAMLRADDRLARITAAEALGQLGDARIGEHLITALGDKDTGVRGKAAEALGKIRDKDSTRALIHALHDRSASVRILAAETLGRLGDPAAVSGIVSAMAAADTAARAPMADALGRIGSPDVIEPLIQRLEDRVWEIQWGAAQALSRIGSPQALDALLAWSRRVLPSEMKRLTAEDKSQVICDVMIEFFRKLETGELQPLNGLLEPLVQIMSWEVTELETGAENWRCETYENPVWTALQAEFIRRKIAPGSSGQALYDPQATQVEAARLFEEGLQTEQENGQEHPAPHPPRPMPRIEGIVAEFLAFLEAKGLDSVVLVGGAVRDTALGASPNDLDVAIQLRMPGGMSQSAEDPVIWNVLCAQYANPALESLAQALQTTTSELISGKAQFIASGHAIPVHYVGPHLIEERRLFYKEAQIESRLHQWVSRFGLVADTIGNSILGLVSTATFDRIWIDAHGHWFGNCQEGLKHLEEGILHVDHPVGNPCLNDVFRILYLRHALGFTLSDTTLSFLESAAASTLVDPERARQLFSRESFDRLVSVSDFESVVEDLDLLDLLAPLPDMLEPAKLQKLNQVLLRRENDRTQATQKSKRDLDAAQSRLKEKKEVFEAKRLDFNKHLDQLDVFKATQYDLDERLRVQITRLGEADRAARQATSKLEAATQKLQNISTDDSVDVSIIQVHRQALATKRELDSEVAVLKSEVEALRTALDKKNASTVETQAEMEQLGQLLEKASQEYQEALSEARLLEAALERIKLDFNLPPEARREKLRKLEPAAGA